MYRLARHDLTRRFASAPTRFAAQILFGMGCGGVMVVALYFIQRWMPLPGPFALVFPAVVIATLYGHWPAGMAALATGILGVWAFVLPGSVPLSFAATSPIGRAVTAAIVGAVLLLLAESFRRTVARAAADRETELARREMMLREFEHRTRNNFALVASLLEFQRRQSDMPEVQRALDRAISRIHVFADAYSQLASPATDNDAVDMKSYLSRLIDRFADALFGEHVEVESDIAELTLASRKAVAVALYVNEAMTNCAKYAFPDGHGGTVKVALAAQDGGWRLTVLDDGIGDATPPGAPPTSGLGSVLFEALATQAGARHEVSLPGQGRRLDLVSTG